MARRSNHDYEGRHAPLHMTLGLVVMFFFLLWLFAQ
jgi:hypothetical protein